jgi:hypothetical protein
MIPDLPIARDTGNPDVQVFMCRDLLVNEGFDCETIYTSDFLNEEGRPNLIVSRETNSGVFRLRYSDGIEFAISKLGTRIFATWPPEAMTLEDAVTYLLGPVLGLVLRLKGVVTLHASSVAVGSKAIAFLGSQGAGKSTLAAAFAILGYPVLGDDVLVLKEEQPNSFLIQPAYPRIRLWPESVPHLYEQALDLPCLTPNWDKRFLQLDRDAYKFQFEPLPLAAIYVLDGRNGVSSSNWISGLDISEGIMRLVSNSYVSYLLDRSMRGHEFQILNRIVAGVPVRSIRMAKSDVRPAQLCEAILEDFQKLG